MENPGEKPVYYSLLSPEQQSRLQEIAREAGPIFARHPELATARLLDVLHAAGVMPKLRGPDPEPDPLDDPAAWAGMADLVPRLCPTCGTALGDYEP